MQHLCVLAPSPWVRRTHSRHPRLEVEASKCCTFGEDRRACRTAIMRDTSGSKQSRRALTKTIYHIRPATTPSSLGQRRITVDLTYKTPDFVAQASHAYQVQKSENSASTARPRRATGHRRACGHRPDMRQSESVCILFVPHTTANPTAAVIRSTSTYTLACNARCRSGVTGENRAGTDIQTLEWSTRANTPISRAGDTYHSPKPIHHSTAKLFPTDSFAKSTRALSADSPRQDQSCPFDRSSRQRYLA